MQLWQIQSKAQPITPPGSERERITADKWQPNTNIPQSNWHAAKVAAMAAIVITAPFLAFTNLGQPERVSADKWQPETNRPVFDIKRQQYTYPVTAPQDPTSMRPNQIWVDKYQNSNQFLYFPDVKRWQHLYATGSFVAQVSQPEIVTVDKWFAETQRPRFESPTKQHLFPSLTFPDAIQATFTTQAIFSQSPVALVFTRTTLYQGKADPISQQASAETVTVDKWFAETGKPVWSKPNNNWIAPLNLVLSSAQRPETVSLDRWQQPQSQPRFDIVRQQWAYPTLTVSPQALTQAERATPDKWQPETNRPLFDVKRQQFLYPSVFFNPRPLPISVFVTADEWCREPDQILVPARATPHLYQSFATSPYSLTQKETVSLDRYQQPQSLPRWDFARNQFTYPSLALNPQAIGTPAQTVSVAVVQTNTPVFTSPKAQHVYQTHVLNAISTVFLEQWYRPTEIPRFDVIRLQYLYPTFFKNTTPVTAPETNLLSKWNPPIVQPLFDRKRTQYQYPSFTTDPKHLSDHETITVSDWFRETQQPRFDVKRWQFLYPYLSIDTKFFVKPPFYRDKLTTRGNSFSDKLSSRGTSFNDKFSGRGTSYSDKNSSRGTSYSDKNSSRGTAYEDKYSLRDF